MQDKNQLKILIADDDDALRLAIVTMVASEGYSVLEARNGREAIEIFDKHTPDIVLVDAVMPVISGYDVCTHIRNIEPDIHTLPILMITVMDDLDSIEKANSAGASDYLTKPIHWPLLMYRLNMLTTQKKLLQQREKVEQQLRQANKLNAIRQLTGGFAHEFNNILATQLGYTELAINVCEGSGDKQLQSYLGEVQKASLRAKLLIEQLMTFAMDDRDLTSVSMIKDVFRESIKSLIKIVPDKINFDAQDKIDNGWIPLDFIQFHEIMLNLLENAIDSIEGDGNIAVTVERQIADCKMCSSCMEEFSGEFLVLKIADSGCGIEKQNVSRIFEPFFTTKPVGKGTGHGMSVIHGIVHAAGGHICVNSAHGYGTVIEIFFRPITSSQSVAV